MNSLVHTQVGAMLSYIAFANKRGVNKLAMSEGYLPPRDSYEARFSFLQDFCKENSDTCVESLVKIHPDRDMIAENIKDRVTGNYIPYEDEFDAFIGEIAGGVSQLGAAGIGKIGERGRNKAALEQSKQEGRSSRIGAISRAKEEESKAKASTTKWIWIGSATMLVIVIGALIIMKVKKII